MRIAVIGAGISGLVAARLLARRHDVTLFEAAHRVGGHANTVQVPLGDGRHAVDTGFIVFNHRSYPNFTRLLSQLRVRSRPSSMSFSVRCDRSGVEWSGSSIGAVFAQRRNLLRLSFHRMLLDILRFNRRAPRLLEQPDGELTVAEYLYASRFSSEFVDRYLVPMGAAIWSCPPQSFFDFPMRFLVRFLDNHGMLSVHRQPQWLVVEGGSRRYVEAIVAPMRERIRTGTPIESVRRRPGGVTVTPLGGAPERFEHVVVACHADTALALLADPTPTEAELLGSFPYQQNDVVLHTDTSLLPRRRPAWASWNYHVPERPAARATLTYNMNILQGLDARETACVTVNESDAIDPGRILARFRYAHPRFDLRAPAAQARHRELIDENRTSFCGAYWGFGFHEDGVTSALRVAEAFGEAL